MSTMSLMTSLLTADTCHYEAGWNLSGVYVCVCRCCTCFFRWSYIRHRRQSVTTSHASHANCACKVSVSVFRWLLSLLPLLPSSAICATSNMYVRIPYCTYTHMLIYFFFCDSSAICCYVTERCWKTSICHASFADNYTKRADCASTVRTRKSNDWKRLH